MTDAEPWEQLFRYWLSKMVDGRPPMRTEMDIPLEVPPRLLANIALIDPIGGRFRYRLVGTQVWERYHFDLSGSWIEGGNPAEAEWLKFLGVVANDQIPRLLSTPVPGGADKCHMAIVLPLTDSEGLTCQILAGLFFEREYGSNAPVGRIGVRELSGEDV